MLSCHPVSLDVPFYTNRLKNRLRFAYGLNVHIVLSLYDEEVTFYNAVLPIFVDTYLEWEG